MSQNCNRTVTDAQRCGRSDLRLWLRLAWAVLLANRAPLNQIHDREHDNDDSFVHMLADYFMSLQEEPPCALQQNSLRCLRRVICRHPASLTGCPHPPDSTVVMSAPPGWQGESSLCSIGRCSHVFGLFARYA